MKRQYMVKEKVCGKRNWTIRIYENTARLYGFGQHIRECGEYIRVSEFYGHSMNIIHFTLKKDALEALATLKSLGYDIIG